MSTLFSALAKLTDHPDDGFPNTLEPLGRWEYLRQEPYNLTQFELNALQNHRFTGNTHPVPQVLPSCLLPSSCNHAFVPQSLLFLLVIYSSDFYVFILHFFLFAGNLFGGVAPSLPIIRFLLVCFYFGLSRRFLSMPFPDPVCSCFGSIAGGGKCVVLLFVAIAHKCPCFCSPIFFSSHYLKIILFSYMIPIVLFVVGNMFGLSLMSSSSLFLHHPIT